MRFDKLGLDEPILRAVDAEGYQYATPIQEKAIPQVMKGRDLIGCAQTGTGKTAAFALPTLQRLRSSADSNSREHESPTAETPAPPNETPKRGSRFANRRRSNHPRSRAKRRKIRALVLSPTRELAVQIGESFSTYAQHTGLRNTVIYGGVSQTRQVRALRKGVDTLIATPGRLLDLIDQGYIKLGAVEVLILDEADRMLDMGFIHDLRRIVENVPQERQTLMFSATMPDEIRQLTSEWLREPVHVQVAPESEPAETVEQSVFFVEPKQKPKLLAHFLHNTRSARTLVFSRTKHGADKIVRRLHRDGIQADAIHGNKSQSARQRVLDRFKSDRLPVLVATDIAARGLDVEHISHVINYDMPHDPETYVHRIGRTGRAGAEGVAVSFCGRDEHPRLRLIERLIRRRITVEKRSEYPEDTEPSSPPSPAKPKGTKPARAKTRRRHGAKAKGRVQPRNGKSAKPGGRAKKRRRRPSRA